MSASDRPTPVGEGEPRDTVEAPPPVFDNEDARRTIIPDSATMAQSRQPE